MRCIDWSGSHRTPAQTRHSPTPRGTGPAGRGIITSSVVGLGLGMDNSGTVRHKCLNHEYCIIHWKKFFSVTLKTKPTPS